MHVLIAAVGTRGDVQPALALALELRKLGHTPRLCISPNFVDWATSLGLEARPMGVAMRVPTSSITPAATSAAKPPLSAEELRRLRENMPDLITDQFDTLRAAADGCDVILGANAHQYAGPSIAEHAGIGYVTAVYAPVAVPSFNLAPPPSLSQGALLDSSVSIEQQWLNTAQVWNERALERVNQNRARLGLAPISDVLDYVLTDRTWLAADAVLAPLPDTGDRELVQTGAWLLTDDTPLPAELKAFLVAGEPPVLVGFGSMPAAKDLSRRVLSAARAAGRRLIVSKGWAELDVIGDAPDCIAIGDVNHDLLLPRLAAVIHHGGAGTTAAAARAGVPQVITPIFSDQFYWAERILTLGLGATTPHASLTQESLTASLKDALNPLTGTRARRVAPLIRRDGATLAARRLEHEYGRARG